MIFSNSCQYAIKSCIYLAVKQDKIDVTEISEFINSPVSFTSKILQKLAKSNIIYSAKGRGLVLKIKAISPFGAKVVAL